MGGLNKIEISGAEFRTFFFALLTIVVLSMIGLASGQF